MNNLFASKAPVMVVLRTVLIGGILLMGAVRLRMVWLTLGLEGAYANRDSLQEYLMARALVEGVNPYLPVDALAARFIGEIDTFSHPPAYPPFMAIFSLPLLPFGPQTSSYAWLFFELACLAGIAILLTLWAKARINFWWAAFIFLVLLAWYPVQYDLLYGQLSILLTALLLAALLALRKERKILAGVLIGLTISIKIITWPLLIYFALKKDWRTVVASCLTALGLNLVALAAMGIGPFSDYYLRVSAQILKFYQASDFNHSVWSIGYRLFSGTGAHETNFQTIPSLIPLPGLAMPAAIVLVVICLFIGLRGAARTKDADIAYAMLVCVVLAVSPLAWFHYYVLTVIPVAVMLRTLGRRSYPAGQTSLFLLLLLWLLILNAQLPDMVVAISSSGQVSFAAGLLLWLPMAEIVGLAWLLGVQKDSVPSNSRINPIAGEG